MEISKHNLISLIDEVITPYKSKYLSNYIVSDDDKLKHDMLLTKFAIMFFNADSHKLYDNFIHLLDFYNSFHISSSEVKFSLAHFFKFYKKWVIEVGMPTEHYFQKIKEVYAEVLNQYEFSNEEEEDFFFFEDDGVDEVINEMHFDDSDKISAVDYFDKYPLNADDVAELSIIKENLEELLETNLTFSADFLIELEKNIKKLNFILAFAFEFNDFKTVGIVFEKFYSVITHIDENQEMDEMVFEMLSSFIADIIKWINTVFISQEAVDIHYLDASLLANIEQFETVVNGGGVFV